MLEQKVDAATSEMMVTQTSVVTTGNLLDKIGSPDYAGWMRKKGEKYNTWKQRFFVLKGVHLYYLKSESVSHLPLFFTRIAADPGRIGTKSERIY